VVAQIAQGVFGKNVFFYMVQVATAMILVLAANTAFAGLPTLASVMAKDGVAPRQFAFIGDRLAFSNGIIVLGIASSVVLFVFDAETHKIIPLYALGVFLAFTLSQSAMVVHWLHERTPRWRLSLLVNATGAVVTAIVTVIVVGTKFISGAWLSLTAMAFLLFLLMEIRKHYRAVTDQLSSGLEGNEQALQQFYRSSTRRTIVSIVPVDGVNQATLKAIAYAKRISPQATAIHVTDDRAEGARLREEWESRVPDVPLIIIDAANGSFSESVLRYIEAVDRADGSRIIVVVLSELVVKHPWDRLLHDSLSRRLRRTLMERPRILIASVPYELKDPIALAASSSAGRDGPTSPLR
jgi:amino acid transporter